MSLVVLHINHFASCCLTVLTILYLISYNILFSLSFTSCHRYYWSNSLGGTQERTNAALQGSVRAISFHSLINSRECKLHVYAKREIHFEHFSKLKISRWKQLKTILMDKNLGEQLFRWRNNELKRKLGHVVQIRVCRLTYVYVRLYVNRVLNSLAILEWKNLKNCETFWG